MPKRDTGGDQYEGVSVSTAAEGKLRSVLSDLGRARATGQLVMRDRVGHQASVQFFEGAIVGLLIPDHRPRIGMRLVAAGVVSPDQLAAALDTQRREAERDGSTGNGPRVGDLLVRSGAISRAVVEQVARAQLADNMAGLLTWEVSDTRFESVASGGFSGLPEAPVDVEQLLVEADARRPVLLELLRRLGGPTAVPELVGVPTIDPHPTLGPHDWALLCKIDGRRKTVELAQSCGFTMLEVAQTLDGLISAGLVSIEHHPPKETRTASVNTAALLRELSSLAADPGAASRRGGRGAKVTQPRR
ncbi:MAG: hypothetical protein Q8P61_08450 [Candidatus Nanopelagicales bacterium]|nr:hypothetical protein [Candidatus Nanopelagicales bacterium]